MCLKTKPLGIGFDLCSLHEFRLRTWRLRVPGTNTPTFAALARSRISFAALRRRLWNIRSCWLFDACVTTGHRLSILEWSTGMVILRTFWLNFLSISQNGVQHLYGWSFRPHSSHIQVTALSRCPLPLAHAWRIFLFISSSVWSRVTNTCRRSISFLRQNRIPSFSEEYLPSIAYTSPRGLLEGITVLLILIYDPLSQNYLS